MISRIVRRRGLPACAAVVLGAASCNGADDEAVNAGIVWGGDRGIEGANVDGGGRRVVAARFGDGQGHPAWSRDGRALAFYVRNSDTVEIHVVRPGSAEHRVLKPDWSSPPGRTFAYVLEPTWAPDGKHLAVSDSWNGPPANAMIRIVSVSTGRWTTLTNASSRRSDEEPAWSPDERTIAFVR